MMSELFQTLSPVDQSVYLERAYATQEEIQLTLNNAQAAQKKWRRVSIKNRADICLKAIASLLENKHTLGKEITQQMGRPIQYTAGEINGFAERARYMIKIAEKKLQDISIAGGDGAKRFIRREPLGVILTLSPWNYPYLTAVNSIIPGIMAGNAVILKPSAQTPLTAERLKSAFDAAGLPQGVFQHVFLTHEMTQDIIQDERVNFVAFTGSVEGGRAVQRAAKDRFIDVGLELGGKDAAYVRQDADLQLTVASLVDGAYFNSGQSCCGIERIYVHETIAKDFIEQFCQKTHEYVLADPLNESTTLGPMVSVKAANSVRQQIKHAVLSGATACIHTRHFKADKADTAYLAPQVLINVDHSMRVMRNESFGPVVGIMSVGSDNEAIELINDSEFGLTASVWTADETRAMAIGDKLQVGTFFMNRCDYLDPALAWSGYKNSGKGCSLSEVAYEKLTRPKSFYFRKE